MIFGSICSGIEAASVAWNELGWKAAWFSEIEPFPSQVLAHHYPDTPNLGDMTLLPERILSGEIEAPDLLCGGTPCQAFSVAGKRQSLDDHRGNLTLTFCEIANAIDSVRDTPAIIFWENVPGVLNTKDNAFGCFLAELAGEDLPLQPAGKRWTNAGVVLGPKRAIAWRVLDAQYFGVAQRRRRVFVVASARDGFDPAKVLFESEGLRRDTAPRREKRQEVTELAGTLAANGGGLNRPAGNCNELDFCVVHGFDKQRIGEYASNNIASTCSARDYKDATDLVVHPLNTMTMQGRPSDDLKPRMGLGIGNENDPCPTITKAHSHAVAYGIPGNLIGRRPENGGNAVEPMVFSETTDCLTSAYGTKWNGNASADNGSLFAYQNMTVRRLTPKECERLQGFPDGYTDIKPKGKDTPDGSRYKALGNSWAVPVVRWIGERIANEI